MKQRLDAMAAAARALLGKVAELQGKDGDELLGGLEESALASHMLEAGLTDLAEELRADALAEERRRRAALRKRAVA